MKETIEWMPIKTRKLIDEEYKQEKMRRQLSPMFNNVKEMIIVEN